MLKIIKKYWDILGGTISGIILSIVVHWELEKIQLIYSVIILILVLIGLFKVILLKHNEDNHLKNQQTHTMLDKLVESQKPMKAIRFSQHPTNDGEELGNLIIETTKGSKKMLKWIKKNKGAIVSCLVALLGLLEIIFNWLGTYLPFELGFNVVGVLMTVIGLVISVLTTGFGSVQFKEAIAQLKDQLNGDKTDLDQINSIKYLERQVLTYSKEVTSIEKTIEDLNKKYIHTLEDVRTCQSLGLNLDETTYNEYEKYKAEYKTLQDKLNSKNGALQIYRNKLEQLQTNIQADK